jgi:tRNA(fMet)-specific endonuclease VapC
MLYLLDINVLTRLARGIDSAIARRVDESALDCRISSVSWYELRYGAARASDPSKTTPRLRFLRSVIPAIEDFDEQAAMRAAEVRASLETMRPNAQPIGPYDILLAGHALSMGAVLVTHNTREFTRVPGLAVEDWQES